MEAMLIGIGLAAIICGLYTMVENHLIFRDMQRQMKKHHTMMKSLSESSIKLRSIMATHKALHTK